MRPEDGVWEKLLDARPDDWGTRLVYADWCDENGLGAMAQTQRWMGHNRKSPRRYEWARDGWPWVLMDTEGADDFWHLGKELMDLLDGDQHERVRGPYPVVRWYKTRTDAEEALCRALVRAGVVR